MSRQNPKKTETFALRFNQPDRDLLERARQLVAPKATLSEFIRSLALATASGLLEREAVEEDLEHA